MSKFVAPLSHAARLVARFSDLGASRGLTHDSFFMIYEVFTISL